MVRQLGAQQLIGLRLVDENGIRVGVIGQVYFDDQTGAPRWVTVRRGFFRAGENFVPLRGARPLGDDVQVPYSRETVRTAPVFPTDRHISVAEEDQIYLHYGLAPETAQEVPEQRPYLAPRGKHAKTPERSRTQPTV
ncbi:PRC-barrel domain-containing protein [Actinorugispora endophytica]|uniref:PRC-barrel domain protein n=1 Tax=Actinorugispora endophytica TaxID=1605990 RepID=A0A4R6UQV8_9ACTN|nr:PRC-barrel domain-containing protein [Actinorugispora endophytica]TDQ45634.1 PRC-barrel domain protein [Actinorugispora endophytica]